MRAFTWDRVGDEQSAGTAPYLEFIRSGALSVGLYVLPAGGVDRQSQHTEDEVYHVVSGRATFSAGGEEVPAGPGSIIFVPALLEHRFHTITEDLAILAVFAPPEGTSHRALPGD